MKNKNNNNILYLFIIIIVCLIYLIYKKNYLENFTETLETFDIIIIAGQSNACGAGSRNSGLSTRGPISTIDTTNPNIKQITGNYTGRSATINNSIILANDPLEHTQDRRSWNPSVGFGMSFAREYIANNPTKKILIVGCGFGGSGVLTSNSSGARWQVTPMASRNLSKDLYWMTIERLRTVRSKVHADSKVVAFLWHQGETDSQFIFNSNSTETLKTQYKNKLKESLEGMRTEIKTMFSMTRNYPIMLAGLYPDRWRNRVTRVVNNASNSLVMTRLIQQTCSNGDPNKIVNGIFVPTVEIRSSGSYNFNHALTGDSSMDSSGNIVSENNTNSHFSATSIRELGKRYYYYYTVEKNNL